MMDGNKKPNKGKEMRFSKILASLVITFALTACGGGGSTPADDNTTVYPVKLSALDKVKSIISGDSTVSVTATELNSIVGVEGALDSKDYVSALVQGNYVDKTHPTTQEIQAVIDSINTPPVNHHPTIVGTPATAIQIDNSYSFIPTASDSDGDSLTFSITNKPSWADFDEATGELSGTPTKSEVGRNTNIIIAVNDGMVTVALAPFGIEVKLTNHLATLSGTPPITINADAIYSFIPTASDSDGDSLTFSITNKPSWANFDSTTGELSGTASNANKGTTSGIVISVSDGTKTVSLPSFDLTVHYVNHIPIISGTPSTAIQADNSYTFVPHVEDVDNDTLVFSITNKPSWASFDENTGKLSGRPTNTNKGTTSGIVISVSDGTQTVSLPAFAIVVKLINHVPTISGTPPITINADARYSFTPTASDSDGDSLTFSITNKPSWADFDEATGELSGTPTNANKGTTSGIIISVSDGTQTVFLPAFDLKVNYINHIPTISGTPLTTINADARYSFTPTAGDSDGDSLTFSITNKPSWANFDEATGELSGTPTNADVKTITGIVISVKDSKGSEVALSAFSLTVVHVNHVPTISGTPITQIDANMPYSFTPTASDSDSDNLTFSITNKPSWADFDEATGVLSGTPSNADVGTTTGIVISVSDKVETVSLDLFNLEVNLGKCSDTNGDQGYAKAAEIASGKIISKKTDPSSIRLWHTSDGKRKVCVVSGDVTLN